MSSSDYGQLPSDGYPEPDDYDPEQAPTLIQGIGGPAAASPPPSSGALHEAQELFNRHDYAGCVQRLRRLPSEQLGTAERRLKTRAKDVIEEIGQLKDVLRRGVKDRQYEGLLPKARRYIELKPDDEKYARLCAKLEAREGNAGAQPSQASSIPALGSPEVVRFLLRYVQVGAFAGAVLGALVGGFWHPQGCFLGGLIGGIVATANEWHRKAR